MFYCFGLAIGVNLGVTQIVASDENRIRFWNIPSGGLAAMANGQAEDGYVGTTTPYLFTQSQFGDLQPDGLGHLWALSYPFSAPASVEMFNLPLHSGDMPALAWNSPLSVLGGGAVTFQLEGMSFDASGNLWCSDQGHNRVFHIRDPITNPVVDIILGQTNAASVSCNQGGAFSYCGPCSKPPTATSLYNPAYLKVDHGGNLYVSDHGWECTGNNRILRWNQSTLANALAAAGGNVTCGIPADAVYGTGGSFTTPSGFGVWAPSFSPDDKEMVVGTDPQAGGSGFPVVYISPETGDNLGPRLQDYGPQSSNTAFDPDGNLYVGEHNRCRILVYYKPFEVPLTDPTPTPPPTPTFTATPNCFQVSMVLPPPTGGFNSPTGNAVDTTRNYLYVADTWNYRIDVYSYSHGTLPVPVTIFGSMGSGNGQFNKPWDVEVDSAGNLYVAEYDNGRVQKLSLIGTTASTICMIGSGAVGPPRGLYVDPTGLTLYVASDSDYVYRYDSADGITYNATATFGGPGILASPTGVCKKGTKVYVANSGDNQLLDFTETAGPPPTYSAPTTVSTSGLAVVPFQVKTDPAGRFFVTSFNNSDFVEFTATAPETFVKTLEDPIGAGNPWGESIDQYGEIFLSLNGTNSVVEMEGCNSTPTGTPTFTPSLTPTPTSTPTPSLSPSLTPSPSPTSTGTWTESPTPSLTRTCSPTTTPTLTATPTLTSTPTSTSTPTFSPTASFTPSPTFNPLSVTEPVIYPNPVRDGPAQIQMPGGFNSAEVKVFTVAFRKIQDQSFNPVPSDGVLTLELTDVWGNRMANGVYYLQIAAGRNKWIKKMLVIH